MFFITCFQKISTDSFGWLDMGTYRTFGFTKTFEDARFYLNKNHYDMRECLYDYAVVEEMNEGIHPDVVNRWFFKFDEDKGGFYQISEPKEFIGYTNISIG